MFRFAFALPLAGLIAALAAHAPAQDLLLYNTLDSTSAIQVSQVGPGLSIYESPLLTRTFIPGIDGNALKIATDVHDLTRCNIHNLFLEDPGSLLSVDRGAIQIWFRIDQLPVSFCEDTIRLFGGPGDLFDPSTEQTSGIGLWIGNVADQPRIHFELFPFDPTATRVTSVVDGWDGADISDYLHQWVKVTALWQRSGIFGTNQTMQLYVNEDLVAATSKSDWTGSFGTRVGIGGSVGIALSGNYAIDDLQVWGEPEDQASFESVFPGCGGSAGVPVMGNRTGDLPRIGTHFTITIDSLPQNRTCVLWGLFGFDNEESFGTPLPWDLGVIGMPGCYLYQHIVFDQYLGNHLGEAEWVIPIPNRAELSGLRFYTQALVLDPEANQRGAIMSNACEARLGTISY